MISVVFRPVQVFFALVCGKFFGKNPNSDRKIFRKSMGLAHSDLGIPVAVCGGAIVA